MADTDCAATLAQLSTSLTALEHALDPLLATPLDQHLELHADEPLVQARAHILASYVVHDLVWVYLKAAGVEPASHPVMQEIERLKGYFAKLKAAQNGQPATESSKPDRPRMQIDKAAANRFISAAISSSRAAVDPDYTHVDSAADMDAEAAGPSGTHTRFTDAEKEDLDRLLEDKDEDDVDVTDDEDSVVEEMLRGARNGLQAAQKARQSVDAAAAVASPGAGGGAGTGKKNKRKAIDPFAGYDQPKPTAASLPPTSTKPLASVDGPPKRKDAGAAPGAEAKEGTDGGGGSGELSKKQRKKLKLKKEAKAGGGGK
ncbi:hypothetical protein JCM3774_003891 [Rhodotorula dairenensis]